MIIYLIQHFGKTSIDIAFCEELTDNRIELLNIITGETKILSKDRYGKNPNIISPETRDKYFLKLTCDAAKALVNKLGEIDIKYKGD